MGNTYGEWIRHQREAAGLTQQQLADMALMTRSHIAHIEAGRRIPSKDDAKRLDLALNTGDVLSSFLPTHGQEVAIAQYFESVKVLEQQATMIREFAAAYFPGLLQTERYARAVLSLAFPPATEEERDKRLVTRLERAKILSDPTNPVMWVVLDEMLLRRAVTDADVLAEQIMHVVRLAESGRVRVHVLRFDAGHHPLMQISLTLMEFEDQPPLAYSEVEKMGKLHDSPSIVRDFELRYARVLGDAQPQKDSLALLRATAKEYGHHD